MTLTNEYQYIGRSSPVTSASGYEYYTLIYARTQGDIATGNHTVALRMRMACLADSTFYGWQTSGHAKVGDATAFSWSAQNVPASAWGTGTLTEGGVTYRRWTELMEGTAAVHIGWGAARDVVIDTAWVMLGSSSKTWLPATGVTASAAITVTLPMIAGATTPVLSAQEVLLGQPVSIATQAMSPDFTHRLTYSFGAVTGEIGSTWTPPLDLAAQIPNAPSGIATVTCATYHQGVQVGESVSAQLKLTVPEALYPQPSATWSDSSGALDKLGTLVQNVSRLAVSVQCAVIYGSPVTAVTVSLAGKSYAGGLISTAGTLALEVTARNSRGHTGTARYSLSVAAYSGPALSLSASRCRGDGTHDDTGEYAHITVSGSVSALSGNTGTLRLTCGGTTQEADTGTGSFSREWIVAADPNTTMAISASLSDSLLTASRAMTLSTAFATMDFLQGGRGIAFGATATKEGFTCAMDTDLSGHRLTGAGSINGVVLGTLDFHTNTEAYIPVAGRTVVLVALSANDHGMGLYALRFFNNTYIGSVTRLAGDQENVTFAVEEAGTLKVTCPINWSYGWYITRQAP